MGEVIRYRGVITVEDFGESTDSLFIGRTADIAEDNWEPLARRIQGDMEDRGSYLSVRYWTADRELGDDQMEESAVCGALGDGEVSWNARYSEITGYLWTDEWINVGGHDLLAELTGQAGRYCLLEIGYSKLAAASLA